MDRSGTVFKKVNNSGIFALKTSQRYLDSLDTYSL